MKTKQIKVKGDERDFEIIDKVYGVKNKYAVGFLGNKGIFGYVTKIKGEYCWVGFKK